MDASPAGTHGVRVGVITVRAWLLCHGAGSHGIGVDVIAVPGIGACANSRLEEPFVRPKPLGKLYICPEPLGLPPDGARGPNN